MKKSVTSVAMLALTLAAATTAVAQGYGNDKAYFGDDVCESVALGDYSGGPGGDAISEGGAGGDGGPATGGNSGDGGNGGAVDISGGSISADDSDIGNGGQSGSGGDASSEGGDGGDANANGGAGGAGGEGEVTAGDILDSCSEAFDSDDVYDNDTATQELEQDFESGDVEGTIEPTIEGDNNAVCMPSQQIGTTGNTGNQPGLLPFESGIGDADLAGSTSEYVPEMNTECVTTVGQSAENGAL